MPKGKTSFGNYIALALELPQFWAKPLISKQTAIYMTTINDG